MKISEILDIDNNRGDLVDTIKLSTLPKIDKFIDSILDMSDNFNVPIEFLNTEIVRELLIDTLETKQILSESFNDTSIWIIKINKILNYLTNNIDR
jgi:hypothetical protein